ncbi:hypothetical protein [Patulibacter sp.]|uniref:hypothetical protein n=1 Tax=Patulibacter sp. TaxID=1912859 RepID=UPI00271933EE|nr:hypothetical protein [Patulibacter sp.]MDO9407580.1 hypothetical protein [Patulibacter sp.]
MRRRPPPPWALTALAALVYALSAPPTTDLAAQSHRVAVARDGVWLFDLSWFGGHHLPGYSVLMPLLGLVLGPAVITALAAVAAAWAFDRLARSTWPGRGGTVAAWWFAAGVGGLQFTGRTTFVLGTAVALGTLLVARRRADAGAGTPTDAAAGGWHDPAPPDLTSHRATSTRRAVVGAIGAALTALASPVAALFLAMVAGAWWLGGLRRSGGDGRDPIVPLVVAVAALGAAAVLSAAFPTGGSEPFVASALWPAVVVLAVVLVVLPREHRTLRIGVALYLVGVLLAGALPTPMGGNATRLAALAGGPVVAAALWGRRPLALALLALPLLWWQWYPPVRDATQAWGDRSARASYWAPVQADLARRVAASPGRVEVVPTARRGEARWITPAVPLARGWIRQLDRDRSPLFYDDLDGPPTARSYGAWLRDEAVSWVVLTDATLDGASEDEAALLRGGRVPGLVRAGGGPHWTVWRVVRPTALATWAAGDAGDAGAGAVGAPRVVRTGPGSMTVDVPRSGLVDLRIRWSPYLRARGGDACLTRGRGGWTLMRVAGRDTVAVDAAPAAPWRRPGPEDCEP